jgi:hypothetical protein
MSYIKPGQIGNLAGMAAGLPTAMALQKILQKKAAYAFAASVPL